MEPISSVSKFPVLLSENDTDPFVFVLLLSENDTDPFVFHPGVRLIREAATRPGRDAFNQTSCESPIHHKDQVANVEHQKHYSMPS